MPENPRSGSAPGDPGEGLRRELVVLRQDEGRTLTKLLASPALRAALGDPHPSVLLQTFDGVVRDLGADTRTLALRNAFGIGLSDPGILKERRSNFGTQLAVQRSPDTVTDWEDTRIEELTARLLAGGLRWIDHLLVVVAIRGGIIQVVAEGGAQSGAPMRQLANPEQTPFLPGFIYTLQAHHTPKRLTLAAVFLDVPPQGIHAEASGDLLAFVCGDGRQVLEPTPGGIADIEAACHAAVSYNEPRHNMYYGMVWAVP